MTLKPSAPYALFHDPAVDVSMPTKEAAPVVVSCKPGEMESVTDWVTENAWPSTAIVPDRTNPVLLGSTVKLIVPEPDPDVAEDSLIQETVDSADQRQPLLER